MQIKKEILLFFTLVLLCITLLMAADYSTKTPANCSMIGPSTPGCCKNYIKNNSNTSPWNFITQGILHLST
ncbi:MAG: hypothetical protein ABI741_09375 [Ferruginibacter sp.]